MGREESLGFTIKPRRSSRHPAVMQIDSDYADDISVIYRQVDHAQELLSRVEVECASQGGPRTECQKKRGHC